jgi:hypothetical protein
MMEWIAAAVMLIAALLLMPTLVGAMRGRRRGPASIGFGSALLELQKIVSPSTERLVEARRAKTQEEAGREGARSDE